MKIRFGMLPSIPSLWSVLTTWCWILSHALALLLKMISCCCFSFLSFCWHGRLY